MNKKEMREQMATIKGGDWTTWYAKLSDENKLLHNEVHNDLQMEFLKRFDK